MDKQVLEACAQCSVLVMETAYIVMSKQNNKDIRLSYTHSILSSVDVTYAGKFKMSCIQRLIEYI